MPHFVTSLEAIYDDSAGDHDREFPTPAAQLLNEIVEMLSGWIAIANTVPEGSPHRRPTNDRVDNENGNIPKSAAIALGLCLQTTLMSDRVSRAVKGALVRSALSTLKDLSRDAGGNGALRRATSGSIIAGGGLGNAQYRECLKELVEDTDPLWLAGIDDFTDALAATGTP